MFLLFTQSVAGTIGFAILFGIPLFAMKPLPAYATTEEKIWKYAYLALCTIIFVFLILPILIIIPLSNTFCWWIHNNSFHTSWLLM